MSEVDLTYKITILHILSKADFPMSNKTLCEFFIDGGYTDYLNVQQAIGNLLDTGMIEIASNQSGDKYSITREGLSTLELFPERITDSIEKDVRTFFEKKVPRPPKNFIPVKKSRRTPFCFFARSAYCFPLEGKVSPSGDE